MATNNYTLGRGKVHFSRFVPGSFTPEGFRYIGNTPEFSLNIESEELDHYNSDEGIREKDDSVSLEVNRTGSLITDNIHPKNVALFFFGQDSVVAQAPVSPQSLQIEDVVAGYSYKIGATPTNPTGYFGIDPSGFTAYVGASAPVAATGTVTFSGVGEANDTVTVGGVTYTLVAAVTQPNHVLIGGSATDTAANLVAAINAGAGSGTAYGTGTVANPHVTASNAAGVVTVTAITPGTVGNSIALAEDGTDIAVSGATLTGGTGTGLVIGTTDVDGVDAVVNYDSGIITFREAGSVESGDDVTITFGVRGSTRDRVISGSQPVEGAMMYVTKNPKGSDSTFFFPYVKIMPNGDYALKGDEWQQIPLSLEILKREGVEAIYRDGNPVYS